MKQNSIDSAENPTPHALVAFMQEIWPMSKEMALQFASYFSFQEIAKNKILIPSGKISTSTYFLEEGYIRSYTLNNLGTEVSTELFAGPCMVNDYLSFFRKQVTSENFQTLSHCKVWTLHAKDVQILFHTFPEYREFGRMMLVTQYARLHERMLSMIQQNAVERYENLLSRQSDIFQHVPLKIIASYLGITDTSLSRIRKAMTKKH